MDTFDWAVYLESNNSTAVPEELFDHVEQSVCNGIKQGMLLEVCHKNNPDVYWIAEITMVCGHLLRIKFIGAKTDFWCDLSETKVHPLGWCGKYDEQIEPPDEINEKYGDKIIDMMKQTLLDGVSAPLEALKNKGLSPIDRIKSGMKVEVQNTLDPYRYWIATVNENIGGRLQLRYDGDDDNEHPLWIFFSNPRLASFGYVTNKGSPWQFKYPGKVNKFSCKNKLSAQLRLCAEESIKEPTPADLFQPDQSDLKVHNFVIGMKLEALDPVTMKTFHPATVSKIYNNYHFLVVIDDHTDDYEDTKMAWLCDSQHPYIYPIGWTQKHNLPLTPPKICKRSTFDWDEYLSMTSSVPAPVYCFATHQPIESFEANMKLEAVNPINHEEIHVASIVRIVDHMMCVELIPIGEKIWYAQKSDLIFPVGWCDSNNYELHIPNIIEPEPVEISNLKPKEEVPQPPEEWCERIYFNYKCYAGPSISRSKLSQLPKHVGPGPLSLVLKEVLNKIISASYKPAKVLRDWETEEPAEEGMRLEMLKAKLKSSTYHAYVPIVTKPEQVPSFCKDVCVKLQACPHLFGPAEYCEACPENCTQQDKSKFHMQTSHDKRGRPKGSLKKKKKKTQDKKEQQQSQENESNKDGVESCAESEHSGSTPPSEAGTRPNSPDSGGQEYKRSQRKRDAKNKYPKLEMKTRGAKLPNFAKQMKESHWNKKDVETIYSNTCVSKKRRPPDSDTENESSHSSSRDARNISDVSDSEEPELKKLKYNSNDPLPSDNKQFEDSMDWMKGKLKLAANPVEWSVDDVHAYLSNTEHCKLVADRMRQEEIDGEAFVMLDLPALQQFLHMKKEYALQVCKHITMLRYYYIVNYQE